MNTLKTGILLTVMTVLLVFVGKMIGGTGGAFIAFLIALAMNGVSYWYSDRIVLTMYGAKPISEEESPGLHSMVGRLTQEAGLPMPKLYVVQTDLPNAFATGRDPEHAAVAVTSGLLRILDRAEVEGVVAHELAHIKNRDILISTVAAAIAGAIMWIAFMARWGAMLGGFRSDDEDGDGIIGLLAGLIVAPIAASLIQLWISRTREYQADAVGAQISGRPLGLANALVKLENSSQFIRADVSPATAHMFIVNPLRGVSFASLFSTHPSTQDRVARLRALAETMGQN